MITFLIINESSEEIAAFFSRDTLPGESPPELPTLGFFADEEDFAGKVNLPDLPIMGRSFSLELFSGLLDSLQLLCFLKTEEVVAGVGGGVVLRGF